MPIAKSPSFIALLWPLTVETETVVLCYPALDADLQKIRSAFPKARVVNSSQEAIGKDIFEATIFCGHAKQKQIDWDAVVEHGKLRWIQSSAAGLDHCLAPAVIESKIIVSGCSGLFANQVSEQTLALLFSMVRSCLLYTSPSPRDQRGSRMPSSA